VERGELHDDERDAGRAFTAWQRVLWGAAAALILMAGIGALNLARETRIAIRGVQHTFKVLLAIDQLGVALTEAETGQRGYLLTGDARYLEPYEAAVPRVAPAVAELRRLTADNPSAQQRVAQIEALVPTKLAEMALTVERSRSSGSASALDIVRTDIGAHATDEIRALLGAMRDEENGLLGARLTVRDESLRGTMISAIALTTVSLLILAAAIGSLRRTLRQRNVAARSLADSEERLRVTLRSIGDAVIATDVAGRIVFLNPVAQALTGWHESEAIGVALEQVFRIFNEFSREPVDSPVAKVLREGVVVGLANHTVLIARDGSEHPIDDSGAPIRGAGGALMGVVLVFRDVTGRREAERVRADLLRAEAERDAAGAANRAKDEFLAVVSHELRSPLAAASGWIEALEAGTLDAADRARAVETIGRSVRLQSLLVSDLLDVSRIVAGKLTIERMPMDVAPIVQAAVEDQRRAAGERNIEVRFDRGVPRVAMVDRARFEQVISNLLSNAIRFTPEGGRIDVALTASGDMHELAVRDSGCGIAPHLLDRVFDRFWQSPHRDERDHGGLGLGLAIAKHMIEQHEGTIVAESDGEGHGTTIRIRLPRYAGSDVVAERPRRQRQPRGDQRGVLDGVGVLLVEDHVDTRDAIAHLLRNRGASVRVADTVDGALALHQAEPAAIVISDLGLRQQSGLDLIQRIRAEEETLGVRTPAIAVSGFVGSEERHKALAAGFDVHLPKPIGFPTLLESILELLARTPSESS
jgi:PAS domain S-box-containing protein